MNCTQDRRKSRIKCAFLDDEAEDEDGNPEDDGNAESDFKFALSANSKNQVITRMVFEYKKTTSTIFKFYMNFFADYYWK